MHQLSHEGLNEHPLSRSIVSVTCNGQVSIAQWTIIYGDSTMCQYQLEVKFPR